jgi:nucleotide-binding universal stress UspA family protein
MYQKILVTLDGTPTDRGIIDHVKELAQVMRARVVLLHVADGWAARHFGSDAVSPEVTADLAYLKTVRDEFEGAGTTTETVLAFGEPADEIVKWIRDKGCDLVAMSTHGHRFFADLFLGTTASRVQHQVKVPVLLLRAR